MRGHNGGRKEDEEEEGDKGFEQEEKQKSGEGECNGGPATLRILHTTRAKKKNTVEQSTEGEEEEGNEEIGAEEDHGEVLPQTMPCGSWEVHPALRTTSDTVKGRGVISAKPLKAGVAIMAGLPLVAAPKLDQISRRCFRCFRGISGGTSGDGGGDGRGVGGGDGVGGGGEGTARGGQKLKRCTGCHYLRYCSAACQRADWRLHHREECGALGRFKANHRMMPTPNILLMSRMMRVFDESCVEEEGGEATAAAGGCCGGHFLELRSNWNVQSEGMRGQYTDIATMVSILRQLRNPGGKKKAGGKAGGQAGDKRGSTGRVGVGGLSAASVQMSEQREAGEMAEEVERIARHFGRFFCNNFTICDAELRPVGSGVSTLCKMVLQYVYQR